MLASNLDKSSSFGIFLSIALLGVVKKHEGTLSAVLTTVRIELFCQLPSQKIKIVQKLCSTQIELFGTTVLVTTHARVKPNKQILNLSTGKVNIIDMTV